MRVLMEKSILRASSVKVCDGLVPHRVVLRHDPESYQPWTTHEETMKFEPDPDNPSEGVKLVHGSFYWGRYFNTEAEAIKDFEARKERFR